MASLYIPLHIGCVLAPSHFHRIFGAIYVQWRIQQESEDSIILQFPCGYYHFLHQQAQIGSASVAFKNITVPDVALWTGVASLVKIMNLVCIAWFSWTDVSWCGGHHRNSVLAVGFLCSNSSLLLQLVITTVLHKADWSSCKHTSPLCIHFHCI